MRIPTREDLLPGTKVTWVYVPQGGYGYSYATPGTVVRCGPKRITIQVTRHGRSCQRSVALENLRIEDH